jgi:hypothetical protein
MPSCMTSEEPKARAHLPPTERAVKSAILPMCASRRVPFVEVAQGAFPPVRSQAGGFYRPWISAMAARKR